MSQMWLVSSCIFLAHKFHSVSKKNQKKEEKQKEEKESPDSEIEVDAGYNTDMQATAGKEGRWTQCNVSSI